MTKSLFPPAIAITAATDADVEAIDKVSGKDLTAAINPEVDGGAAVRFYGKLVAVCDEYGTTTCIPGIDQDQIEVLLLVANNVWPRRYIEYLKDPNHPEKPGIPTRVCHRCGYNEHNHNRPGSPAPYTEGNCEEFVDVPEHLRF